MRDSPGVLPDNLVGVQGTLNGRIARVAALTAGMASNPGSEPFADLREVRASCVALPSKPCGTTSSVSPADSTRPARFRRTKTASRTGTLSRRGICADREENGRQAGDPARNATGPFDRWPKRLAGY